MGLGCSGGYEMFHGRLSFAATQPNAESEQFEIARFKIVQYFEREPLDVYVWKVAISCLDDKLER